MEYVMVPVPEELAPKVLAYVSWKGVAPTGGVADAPADATPAEAEEPDAAGGDGGPIARAFARLDDASRALVAVAATAALEEEELTIPKAARRAGVSTREALGIFMEVNNVIVTEGGPPIGFSRKDQGSPAAGEFTWETHIVVMPEALAQPLRELARSDASA